MQSFAGHFLIAMPSMDDPFFARSLTYICEHNDKGAMGLVINQSVGMNLQELIQQADKAATPPDSLAEQIVVAGGPVSQDRGFVLHTSVPGYASSLDLDNGIMVTTSKDILADIGDGKGPEKSLVALGYAGWTAGQLEEEVQHNAWLLIEADLELMFDVPMHQKWQSAVQKLGIDVWQLGPDVGHA